MNLKMAEEAKRDRYWLVAIICFGVALRTLVATHVNHRPESDELAYISMAINLISGNGIVDQMGNRAMYNVGYPLVVLSPVFLFFGEDFRVARLFNVLLGGAAIVLTYLVAKEAGAGRFGRLMAAAIWAIYLPASVYGIYLLKENLMIPLMLGVIWCALKLAKQSSMRVAAVCGTLLGLLALTGNAALSLAGAVALALVATPAPLPRRMNLAMVMLAVGILVTSPWIIRNMQAIGAPVLNTNGGFNLYLGNNPAATGMFVSIAETPRGSTWADLRRTGEVQASETLKQEAIAWVKANPSDFLALSLRKAIYFWTPPVHQGKGETSSAERIARVLWTAQFALLLVAALGTLLIRRLRTKELAILWLSVVCYTAVHMVFYVIFRYREPIMPALAVMAALAIEALVSTKSLPLRNPRLLVEPLKRFPFDWRR